jgi:putative DNA primase/helicase
LDVNNDLTAALGRARDELGLVIVRPVFDGRLHRCPVEGDRKGSLDGAYRICLDHPANIWGQNFKTGAKAVYPFGGHSRNWGPAERRAWAAKVEADRKAREALQRTAWAEAAERAERIYAGAKPCQGHPYLDRKGVQPHFRLRVLGPDLVVPLFNAAGELRTLQFISPDGKKRFLQGGQKSGYFLSLATKTTDRRQALLICEGLATGLSLSEATGMETLVAFAADGLKAVALGARRDWPDRAILLSADNDAGGTVNIGVAKAKEAALAIGGRMAIPIMADGRPCDFNDLHQVEGPETVQAFINVAYEPGKEGRYDFR